MSAISLYAIVADGREWVDILVRRAIKVFFPSCKFIYSINQVPLPTDLVVQFSDGQNCAFNHILDNQGSSLVNMYSCNSALSRKAHLAQTVNYWTRKRPHSILKSHVPETLAFEVDYSDYLEEALDEAFELHQSFAENALFEPEQREWWILKGSLVDAGLGIGLFSTMEELHILFKTIYCDGSEESGSESEEGENLAKRKDPLVTSSLREFVVQRYLDSPLLLANKTKFHIRAWVLAVGWLKVYLNYEMLALFSQEEYCHPGQSTASDKHLTNSAAHHGLSTGLTQKFWELPDEYQGQQAESNSKNFVQNADWKTHCFKQIRVISAEVFEAAARTQPAGFSLLPNTFELFGMDFLVDSSGEPWLLEVNAGPSFRQTTDGLDEVIERLFSNVVEIAVRGFFLPGEIAPRERGEGKEMVKILDIDLAIKRPKQEC